MQWVDIGTLPLLVGVMCVNGPALFSATSASRTVVLQLKSTITFPKTGLLTLMESRGTLKSRCLKSEVEIRQASN
jgi:hypothetical protein